MPMRGSTHFLSLSLSLPVSQFLSLSLFLSFLIILNLLNNNNINNSRAEITLWGKSDSQREEASGVNTTTGDSFSETPSPPTEPLLPPSRFLFLKKKKKPLLNALSSFEISNIRLCVQVYMCLSTLSWLTLREFLRTLTSFIQDALTRRGSWHCVWHHTPVAVFDVLTPPAERVGAVSSNANAREEEEDR